MRNLKPVTPDELLPEELLKPMEISQYRLAKEIDVPALRIGDIVAGKRTITADTVLCLCRIRCRLTAAAHKLTLPPPDTGTCSLRYPSIQHKRYFQIHAIRGDLAVFNHDMLLLYPG